MKNNAYLSLIVAILFIFGCNQQNGLGLNENAAVNNLEDLPENPLLLNAITTSIYPKDSSMTVLYGNNLAYNYAKTSDDSNYPTGSVLYIVNWQLQEDEQWFGANIPKNIRKIERVAFLNGNKTEYKRFDLKGIEDIDPFDAEERTDQIKGMKMAISPL